MNSNIFQKNKKQDLDKEINNFMTKDYISKIDSLKSYIQDLESEIRALRAQVKELTSRNIALIDFEHENDSLNKEKKELKQIIEDLEQDIISTKQKEKEEARETAIQLENEINNYKRITETGKGKIEAAEHIIKLNSIQHNYILKLEQEIENMKKDKIIELEKINIGHDLQFKNLKKKMIDIIRKSNKEIQKENITNIEIRSLFTTINKNEMLDELEKQNQQILKLIKQNEIKDKQILNLTQEKEAFYSVDKILKKKNLKFSKLISNFLEKHNINNEEDNKNGNNNIKAKDDNLLFKTTMENKNTSNFPKTQKNDIDLLNKYNSLKERYEYVTDKERLIQKKYSAIINLYETALKELLKDGVLKAKKINIDFDKIIKGDIDSFNKEEKIKIVSLLIKHLLPLIKTQSNDIIKMRNIFNNIDIKLKINSDSNMYSYSRNQNSNIIRSLYDIRQFTSELNHSLKKEENLKTKNKSIFNTYNNTYYNTNHNNIKNLINSKEESKSIKSSFLGLNLNTSAIKKKDEKKLDKNINKNYNKFSFTSYNFYKKSTKSKNNAIKLYKKENIRDELLNKNPTLQRTMFFNNALNKTKGVTEKNLTT